MSHRAINKGDFLISLPSNFHPIDTDFNQSVIFITDNLESGHMGFILNKPTGFLLSEIVPESTGAFTVYNGGPVETDRLFYIHKCPDLIPDSLHIVNDIYLGGDYVSIFHLIDQGLITHNEIRFFMGYSGWDVNQLESEIKSSFWKCKTLATTNIFTINTKNYWRAALQSLGPEYKLWLNTPENPGLN